jgi:hypothetical protein
MTVDATQGLVMQVDYNDFIISLNGKCPVRPAGLDDSIISYDIDPIVVDCVLEDR